MRRGSNAARGIWAGLLALVLVGGCTSFTARIAGWYITREIDSYLDLTSKQHDEVRVQVDALLVELRRDSLPRWLNLFRASRDTVDDGATDEKLRTLQDRYDALMEETVDLLVPEIAIALAKLDDAQIDYFQERMREKLDETYEEHDGSPEERRTERDEKLIDGLENIVGDLDAAQRRVILAKVHERPSERDIQYSVGKQRIQEGTDFLRKHPGKDAIEAELHRLWDSRYEAMGALDKPKRRLEQREILLTIDGVMTRDNRDHAVETLNGWIRKARRFVLTDS